MSLWTNSQISSSSHLYHLSTSLRTTLSLTSSPSSGQVLVSGDSAGIASVINAETGLIMRVISDHKQASAAVTALDFSALSPHWLIATADRRVSVWAADWDVDSNKMISWLSFPGPAFTPSGEPLTKDSALPPSLALFSPIEKHVLLYTGYGLYQVYLFHKVMVISFWLQFLLQPIFGQICKPDLYHFTCVIFAIMYNNLTWLLLQEISFYHIKTKEMLRKIDLAHWATALTIAPNSNLIVVGSHDRLLTIVDYSSGTFQVMLCKVINLIGKDI